jgi:hypothetical protein
MRYKSDCILINLPIIFRQTVLYKGFIEVRFQPYEERRGIWERYKPRFLR